MKTKDQVSDLIRKLKASEIKVKKLQKQLKAKTLPAELSEKEKAAYKQEARRYFQTSNEDAPAEGFRQGWYARREYDRTGELPQADAAFEEIQATQALNKRLEEKGITVDFRTIKLDDHQRRLEHNQILTPPPGYGMSDSTSDFFKKVESDKLEATVNAYEGSLPASKPESFWQIIKSFFREQ